MRRRPHGHAVLTPRARRIATSIRLIRRPAVVLRREVAQAALRIPRPRGSIRRIRAADTVADAIVRCRVGERCATQPHDLMLHFRAIDQALQLGILIRRQHAGEPGVERRAVIARSGPRVRHIVQRVSHRACTGSIRQQQWQRRRRRWWRQRQWCGQRWRQRGWRLGSSRLDAKGIWRANGVQFSFVTSLSPEAVSVAHTFYCYHCHLHCSCTLRRHGQAAKSKTCRSPL